MQPALFDSSIYITALRRGDDAALALRRFTADAPLWLSAVVLEELYAGAADRDRQVLERLERDFDRAKRILIPNLSDWTQAGRVLARFAARGHRGGARHCRAAWWIGWRDAARRFGSLRRSAVSRDALPLTLTGPKWSAPGPPVAAP